MTDRPVVLIALHDGARAESLAAALEADGDFLTTLEAVAESADVSVSEASGGELRILAGMPGDGGQAGATLPRDADIPLILAAVRLVAAGFDIIKAPQPDDEAAVVGHAPEPRSNGRASPTPSLSAREREVLALLADGAPNKVIARKLDISVHTAKFHVASLLTKLGAVNRTDAIAIAMREGLVSV